VSGIEFQSCLGGNRKSSAADGGKWSGSHTEISFLLLATYFGNCTKGLVTGRTVQWSIISLTLLVGVNSLVTMGL